MSRSTSAAPPPRSPELIADRSTPSRAGRSSRAGGTGQSSASTGGRCSTTTCSASSIKTCRATSGSSSGSMTEVRPASARRTDLGAGSCRRSFLVGHLMHIRSQVQVDTLVAAEPDTAAVGQGLVKACRQIDPRCFDRRAGNPDVEPTGLIAGSENRVPDHVGAEHCEARTILGKPAQRLAVLDRQAVKARGDDEANPARLRIRAAICEPEDTRTAGNRVQDHLLATDILQSASCEVEQEESNARAFPACVAQPDAFPTETDDRVAGRVTSRSELIGLVHASGYVDHMEPLRSRSSGDLDIEMCVSTSIRRDRALVDREPSRKIMVVIGAVCASRIDGHSSRRVVDERPLQMATPVGDRNRQPAGARTWVDRVARTWVDRVVRTWVDRVVRTWSDRVVRTWS